MNHFRIAGFYKSQATHLIRQSENIKENDDTYRSPLCCITTAVTLCLVGGNLFACEAGRLIPGAGSSSLQSEIQISQPRLSGRRSHTSIGAGHH